MNGGFVASGVTVSVFVSLFPLMLVAIAVVGFLAVDDADVAEKSSTSWASPARRRRP